ncbi:response regulator [Falsirhodobacter sp. alg1]|uniref:response regulator n=1 Tax=Falsirhodobacter sp. alg1 TaxID=1472418 RepID=UPI0005ED9655|nr:response regulator [Falsirhodobacter sp. alg1]
MIHAPIGLPVRRALVVEDEFLVAMLIEDYLRELGVEVVDIARRLDQGLDRIERNDFDFAVLDINLAGQVSFPIADRLHARGIPFIFATANDRSTLAAPHGNAPLLSKPFALSDLERVLGTADLHMV